MQKYHPLTVAAIEQSHEALSIVLEVPPALRETFAFRAGQHLPLQAVIDGKPVRRTYSICCEEGEFPLQLGIRIQPGGVFCEWAAEHLKAGDTLEVMPPRGHFHLDADPAHPRTYAAFAAGSGITPIISNIRTLLASERDSQIVLFYGNRAQASTMFIDELYALKNLYPERLALNFIFSREPQEYPIFEGRLDGAKARALLTHFCAGLKVDKYLVCGPGNLLKDVRNTLAELGVDPADIHGERFGVPRKGRDTKSKTEKTTHDADAKTSEITVIADGRRRTFTMHQQGASILDGAIANGMELPYSCKAGVCSTCRTRVVSGEVNLPLNYALEPWELEQGYTLACQAEPLSDQVTVDYDQA